MQKYRCYFHFFVAVILFTTSCKNSEKEFTIGEDLVNPNSNIVFCDSVYVKTSTLRLDSVPTAGYSKALVGIYNDTLIGKIEAKSFFQLGVPFNIIAYNKNALYDSCVLVTKINYYYGDTLKPFTLEVWQIADDFYNNLDITRTLYNNSKRIPQYDSLRGVITFIPKPVRKDSINIALDKKWGSQLFQLLFLNDEKVANQTIFMRDYFKGIALVPGNNNASILGLNMGNNFQLRLYYHTNLSSLPVHIDFTIANSPYQFNKIDIAAYKKLSILDTIKNVEYSVPASETNGKTFVQAGTGYRTKIEFPSLINFRNPENKVKILKAILYITPARASNLLIPWPSSLELLSTKDFRSFSKLASGNLVNHSLYDAVNPAYYAFDITPYVKSIIESVARVNPSIMVTPPLDKDNSGTVTLPLGDQNSSSLDRLIIGNGSLRKYSTRLEITYWSYDKHN